MWVDVTSMHLKLLTYFPIGEKASEEPVRRVLELSKKPQGTQPR
jgi:hypothetical protein